MHLLIFRPRALFYRTNCTCRSIFLMQGCTKWRAGGAAAPPDSGGSEGAAGQRRHAALLPAPPDFWPLVHPWVIHVRVEYVLTHCTLNGFLSKRWITLVAPVVQLPLSIMISFQTWILESISLNFTKIQNFRIFLFWFGKISQLLRVKTRKQHWLST